MSRVYVIAEAGVNHNGSLELALQLVDAAAAAGADAVKFQTFTADTLVSRSAPKAAYQIATTNEDESQHAMIRKLELAHADHAALVERCKVCGIDFLSTPFDPVSLDFLVHELGVERLKFSSGDLTNAPLLLRAARTGLPVILSTGMSVLGEVETALAVLAFGYTEPDRTPSKADCALAYASAAGRDALRDKVTLLHCTTEYPAAYADINLNSMATLRNAFGLSTGYSDHSPGIAVPIAAIALGASVLEKHFTLDRSLPGPDHKASLDLDALSLMVEAVRQVELALGSAVKAPAACELANIPVARKSLVAAADIRKGDVFTAENLTVKRPGDGVSPVEYWDWLGRVAQRDYRRDEKVEP
ncbi:MAG: N-acetylneuraminate synthase [Betaproteobacteria bacterium]|nr:N-acetylneuraminate synthase [Betaproteobacteria bacterium]